MSDNLPPNGGASLSTSDRSGARGLVSPAATPNDFFTVQSLGTFAGATSATFFAANALQQLLDVNPTWIALAVAELICIGVVFANRVGGAANTPLFPTLFVVVLNGFLVFGTASGMTGVTNAIVTPGSEAQVAAQERAPERPRAFLTPWP